MSFLVQKISELRPQYLEISTITIIILISHVAKCSFEIDGLELDDDICPGEGFYPDPHSCTKFYRCVETFSFFYAYEFHCPQRTVFDPETKVCNHPYAVHPNYRCFMGGNLFDMNRVKQVRHIIHVLNDTSVLHQFVNSNELDIIN